MNNQKAKKIRQAYKRDLRKNMTEAKDIVLNMFRDKPKYLPRFIWRYMIKMVIKPNYLKYTKK